MNKLIELISDSIESVENPAVYISGGLDSTIVLHHVDQKA